MRGKYKYICDDCGEDIWMSRSERTNRPAVICHNCGGHYLSASKRSVSHERIAMCNEEEAIQHAKRKSQQNFRPVPQ